MKKILFILLAIFISPATLASITCEGTGKTGTKIKYILSDVKGKSIQIEYFVSSRGKMEPIINNTATLVAEGRAIFGNNNVIERSYILPTNDNSFAILFLIYADGTASFTARPMEGTANFVEAKCK
jgi:hypothetical protein